MERYLSNFIKQDLHNKIVLLAGARQCGKTTLSKNLGFEYDYFNIDNNEHFSSVSKKYWDRSKELLILDEFHKFKNWKKFIKGVYDTEGINPKILITGSARLDSFTNVGDSLAGRYFHYRLHPIDIKEAYQYLNISPDDALVNLLQCSGFPEPFLKQQKTYYKRWRKTHHDIILQQDLIDLTLVKDVKSVRLMAKLLEERIGGSVNYSNLAQDLQVSSNAVKSWLEILENIYMFFKVTPYSKNIARSILKEPKIYCYDTAIPENKGAKIENLVACCLIKHLDFLEDVRGKKTSLNYCRTKDGKEIDFVVKVEEETYLIEVKHSDHEVSPHFGYFAKYFDKPNCIQLVKNLNKEYSNQQGYKVVKLAEWLANIDLNIK